MVDSIRDLDYADRLKYLKLPSIKYRQLRGDLIQTYKIVNELDNIDKNDFFRSSLSTNTRNAYHKLQKEHAKSSVRANFLPNRVKNMWNNLSERAKSADNINSFKNIIDNELKHLVFDYYGSGGVSA